MKIHNLESSVLSIVTFYFSRMNVFAFNDLSNILCFYMCYPIIALC